MNVRKFVNNKLSLLAEPPKASDAMTLLRFLLTLPDHRLAELGVPFPSLEMVFLLLSNAEPSLMQKIGLNLLTMVSAHGMPRSCMNIAEW